MESKMKSLNTFINEAKLGDKVEFNGTEVGVITKFYNNHDIKILNINDGTEDKLPIDSVKVIKESNEEIKKLQDKLQKLKKQENELFDKVMSKIGYSVSTTAMKKHEKVAEQILKITKKIVELSKKNINEVVKELEPFKVPGSFFGNANNALKRKQVENVFVFKMRGDTWEWDHYQIHLKGGYPQQIIGNPGFVSREEAIRNAKIVGKMGKLKNEAIFYNEERADKYFTYRRKNPIKKNTNTFDFK